VETNQDHERRRFRRVLFDAPVEIVLGDATFTTLLVDLSLKGALVQTPAHWPGGPGTEARITVRLDEGDDVITMDGQVVHQEESHVGFQCLQIDMDSITHLRRLVELNLGDAELLERELSQLG